MTVTYDGPARNWPSLPTQTAVILEERYDVLKEIGDGSFGSVVLGRVRSSGAHIARRGTLVAIKTMKKTFDSFTACLELREVIFLRTLPNHPHLVPAMDIFLDPCSKKLHIAMEYMDGNLYQLMKSRDHKQFDGASVKSILCQIMAGLEHIHDHQFFHRDIKPENILVTTSAPHDTGSTFKRYSALVTPPATPPAYTIKIADFGLARETHSKLPYTTYVSTRWYRAPEVLLRAGEYSAPVDIWAVGAMAVEIATLKPLFPGGNEVDQVWRVCEIMGSPGSWVNKHNAKVGGGEWKDGVRLAQKLGFSFPKMAPHTMDSILQPPQWPLAFSEFVTWCLMWDPKNRPTSTQALRHEYFADAYDPLRPKTAASSRLLSSKMSSLNESHKEVNNPVPQLTTKTSSWFRKSLVSKDSNPLLVSNAVPVQAPSPRPLPVVSHSVEHIPTHSMTHSQSETLKVRPSANKRATWANGLPSNAAPIPILPSIRPISPLVSVPVNVQSTSRQQHGIGAEHQKIKIGRQLSVASNGNHTHYPDLHRQEAERTLNGNSGLMSPTSAHKESFFSHLRKRARRFSGRYQTPITPSADDLEATVGCSPWIPNSNRQSMLADQFGTQVQAPQNDLNELDKALQTVRYSLEAQDQKAAPIPVRKTSQRMMLNPMKRLHSLPPAAASHNAPVSSRTRRSASQMLTPQQRYETPDEEDELLDEALSNVRGAMREIQHQALLQKSLQEHKEYMYKHRRPQVQQSYTDPISGSYVTPSHSASMDLGLGLGGGMRTDPTGPISITKPSFPGQAALNPQWPTPPYEENDWAASAAASIFAVGATYH